MARLFWAALGAAAGVYAVRKVTKAAEAYTPAGVAHGLSDFADGLRELADAVREGMSEREEELRLALGIDAGTDDVGAETTARRLDAETARRLIEDPTGRFDSRAR
jgi:D-serine deaminase-like pyridoxal phosphate-dependent protein